MNISLFVGLNYSIEDNLDLLVKNIRSSSIQGFNGSILVYDINYAPMQSHAYRDGVRRDNIKGKFVHSSVKSFKSAGKMNYGARTINSFTPVMPIKHGFPPYIADDCMVHIWVDSVYEDDCLVSENWT